MNRRQLRVIVLFAVLLAIIVGNAGPAMSTQLFTTNPSGKVLAAPSGLTVSLTEVDGVSTNPVQTTGMGQPWWAINPWPSSQWTPGFGSQLPLSWWMTNWDFKQAPSEVGDCPITASRNQEMRCSKGSVTLNFSRPVTDPVISIANVGASASGYASSVSFPLAIEKHGWGIWTLDTANSSFTGTPGLSVLSSFGDFAVVSDGSAYHLPGSLSRLNGQPAITRASDGVTWKNQYINQVGSFGNGSVKLSGTWTSVTFNRDLLWVYDTSNPTTKPLWGSWPDQGFNECILNQMPGTVYTCVQQGNAWVPGNVNQTAYVHSEVGAANPMPEGTNWTVTVEEDFGNAPATYDATNGASHMLSDLRIGTLVGATAGESSLSPGIDANNAGSSGIVSPNAGGSDAGTDAFSRPPLIPTSGDYTVHVPLSGASTAGRVCGYLDLNKDGSFETSAPEQKCADFAPGATEVSLVWSRSTIPSSDIGWSTWLRLRASYDVNGVLSPLGRLDSGEVEDWQVVVGNEPIESDGPVVTPSFAG